jgi:hypothetical protein
MRGAPELFGADGRDGYRLFWGIPLSGMHGLPTGRM